MNLSYSNISISRTKNPDRSYTATVKEGKRVVNSGTRPVDHNFADRVQNKIEGEFYGAKEENGVTTFFYPAF